MNVHVFANTNPTNTDAVREEADSLVHDATFVDGWRDVPLPSVDPGLLTQPDDIAHLEDFVHFFHEQKHTSSLTAPSPGQARTRSEPNHSPAALFSQRQTTGYEQQSVRPSTLFDSAFYTRQFEVPASPSIYGTGSQRGVFPLPSLPRIQDSTVETTPSNVLPLSISLRTSFDTPQSIPPNQQQLYANQRVSNSMQGRSQDSLYGSHELGTSHNHSATRSSFPTQHSSLDSLYASAPAPQSHPQSNTMPQSLTEGSHPPYGQHIVPRPLAQSYDYSLAIPPNQAQLYANRTADRPYQDSLYGSPLPRSGTHEGNGPSVHPSSQDSLYGSSPAQGSRAISEQTSSRFMIPSSRLLPSVRENKTVGTQSPSAPFPAHTQEEVLPGSVFMTTVNTPSGLSAANMAPRDDPYPLGRYEASQRIPPFQQRIRDTDDDDPPGLSLLPRISSTPDNELPGRRSQPGEGEDAAMDIVDGEEEEEEIPGLGSLLATQTQNEWLQSRKPEEDESDRALTFNLGDVDSGMGESGMEIDREPSRDNEEDEEYAVEQDLTDVYGMQASSFVTAPPNDTADNSQTTAPASPTASPPDPLSGPYVHWSQILPSAPALPSQAHSNHPLVSQRSAKANPDLSQQREYPYDPLRASPVPSAYLTTQDGLARAQARELWGEKYDRGLLNAYGRGHRASEDPYAELYNDAGGAVGGDDGVVASQDSRAADFAEDDQDQNFAQAHGSPAILPPRQEDEESRANPNSPYIPPRSLSSQPRSQSQPGQSPLFQFTPASYMVRAQTLNPSTLDSSSSSSFRPRTFRPPTLPPLPGQVVRIPFAGQHHPRRPSDTVVPDSQESDKGKSRIESAGGEGKRKRVERPMSLSWVLPTPHSYTIPIQRYVPPEPTPPEVYRPSQDSIYGSSDQRDKGKGKGKEKESDVADPPPRPDPFIVPNPLLYSLPASQSSQSSQPPAPLLPEQTRKKYASDPKPQPLPPFTVQLVKNFLTSPHSRCAWVLPVRGTPGEKFGWNVTSASMLVPIPSFDSSKNTSGSGALPQAQRVLVSGDASSGMKIQDCWQYLLPTSPTSVSSLQDAPGSITWTADALRALWSFLLQIREARRVGLVGLVFVLASPPSTRDRKTQAREREREKKRAEKDPFVNVDYIKIYLDARYAMHVRELLHFWRYECQLPPEVVEVRRQREKEKAAEESKHPGQTHNEDVGMDVDGEGVGKKRESAKDGARGDGADVEQSRKEKEYEKEREDVASFRMFRGARLVMLDEKHQAVLTC